MLVFLKVSSLFFEKKVSLFLLYDFYTIEKAVSGRTPYPKLWRREKKKKKRKKRRPVDNTFASAAERRRERDERETRERRER